MRGKAYFVLLLLFFSLGFASAEHYIPQWVKPGVYFTYSAITNTTVNWTAPHAPSVLVIIYNVSGEPVGIYYRGNVTMTFLILDVSSDMATIKLTVSGDGVVVRTLGNVTPIWNEKDIVNVDTFGNQSLIYLKRLELESMYLINLTTGYVYDLRGNRYGRTLLWYNPYLKLGDYLFTSPGELNVTVSKIETLNETFLTFYRPFRPPTIIIMTSPFNVKMGNALQVGGKAMAFYDPSTGFLLSFLGVGWADFQACGFLTFMGSTRAFPEGDGLKLGGLLLSDTNAEAVGNKVPYETSTSPLLYVYLLSVAGAIIVSTRR
ncbi:conserved membrane protein of unknown function [Thermococcus nautili]|uniref:hypothetical protein n=1 Tax=Thermococcus nautili TaxID=195522 RepID=UPI0025551674|nr:hypothetical protein [Thermococcus nautili]CAI1492095.1 conserved membrane protein of unknown function [Thermococcus nautili]